MKKQEEKKIEEGFEASVEMWGQSEKDDSMVGESNEGEKKEDHKVAEEVESRAQPEGVQTHGRQQGPRGSSPWE